MLRGRVYSKNSMALTKEDRKDIRDIVRDTVIEAMEQLMLPRFDEQDERFDAIEKDLAIVKEDMHTLKNDVQVLKGDMRQVKSTLYNLDGRAEALENDIKSSTSFKPAAKISRSPTKSSRNYHSKKKYWCSTPSS